MSDTMADYAGMIDRARGLIIEAQALKGFNEAGELSTIALDLLRQIGKGTVPGSQTYYTAALLISYIAMQPEFEATSDGLLGEALPMLQADLIVRKMRQRICDRMRNRVGAIKVSVALRVLASRGYLVRKNGKYFPAD